MARLHHAGVALVAALVLSACAAGAAGAPNWSPKPSFSGEGRAPGNRQPVQPAPGSSGPSGSTNPASPGPSRTKGADPAVVATKLTTPTGIAILPDNTALVGERTTGRIVRVQPQPGKAVQVLRTITGIDSAGDGGLLDLALSPNYAQDNLIFAYMTTATDNRVVDFTLTGPVTPVLTGIPKGTTDNGGRIAFGPDGDLYIGTGDAGTPSAAADSRSLAGKVLRVTDIGAAAPGNPVAGSRVFTSGHRTVAGLCIEAKPAAVFETEPRDAGASDPVNLLSGGSSYGWPVAGPRSITPLAVLPAADRSPGGCAVLDGVLYLTSLDGQAMLSASIQPTARATKLGTFEFALVRKYGRLRTIVAARDGALWLTTSNKDGQGKPIGDDERVLRITPTPGGGANSV